MPILRSHGRRLYRCGECRPAPSGFKAAGANLRCLLSAVCIGFCAPATQANDAYQVPLAENFDGPALSPNSGLYYKKNKEQAAGSVEFQRDIYRSPPGALKLSVRPLCEPADEECSERAEVWERPELWTPYDKGIWYGFSVKFGPPIPDDDHRYLIAQWKRQILRDAKGDFSPFLAFRLKKGKLFITAETNLLKPTREFPAGEPAECATEETPVWLRPETNQTRAFIVASQGWQKSDGALFNACTDQIKVTNYGNPLPRPDSGWIDFVVYSKPGPDGSGRIEIYADGEPIVKVSGHIGHADPGLGPSQYFKFGPYRAGHEGVWTLYFDDFRRSPHCADVLPQAACPF